MLNQAMLMQAIQGGPQALQQLAMSLLSSPEAQNSPVLRNLAGMA